MLWTGNGMYRCETRPAGTNHIFVQRVFLVTQRKRCFPTCKHMYTKRCFHADSNVCMLS